LPKENFRRRLLPAPCELPQFGSQRTKEGLDFIEESLAEDFSMFGFGRAAVPRRATLQTSNKIIVYVAQVQVSGHQGLHEIVARNGRVMPLSVQMGCSNGNRLVSVTCTRFSNAVSEGTVEQYVTRRPVVFQRPLFASP
jgi:hypothetical protein